MIIQAINNGLAWQVTFCIAADVITLYQLK